MKTKAFNIIVDPNFDHSFLIKHCKDPQLFVPLHFHQNFEIMAILQGEGTRFVGTKIETFGPGDLVLIGKETPHVWFNSKEYNEGNKDLCSEIIVLNFDDQHPGFEFFKLPEFRNVRNLLTLASRGIRFTGQTQRTAFSLLKKMETLKDANRFIALLNLLNFLAASNDNEILCNESYQPIKSDPDPERISKIYQYVYSNYNNDLSEKMVADHIGMNTSSFSRYFKTKTYKNFSTFLNEVRVSQSAKMILEDKLPISEIAYLCGYSSISNFNRQFKKAMKRSPLEYKKKYYSEIAK